MYYRSSREPSPDEIIPVGRRGWNQRLENEVMGLSTAGNWGSFSTSFSFWFLPLCCRSCLSCLPFVFFSGVQIKQLVKVRAELLSPTVVFLPESQGFPMEVAKHLLDLPFKKHFVAWWHAVSFQGLSRLWNCNKLLLMLACAQRAKTYSSK